MRTITAEVPSKRKHNMFWGVLSSSDPLDLVLVLTLLLLVLRPLSYWYIQIPLVVLGREP